MNRWLERILQPFTPDLARLWIVADPDDVLRNEQALAQLRARGFELLPFEDSILFRAEYEERFRAAWDAGTPAPAHSLILHWRGTDIGQLPWDYLRQARTVSLSLADLFPQLSYNVVRQIDSTQLAALFEAQDQFASQSLGDAASKDFVLTHLFRLSPHLISSSADLWRELLKLHYRDQELPPVLALHMASILSRQPQLAVLPLADLFARKAVLLRMVQSAWYRYLAQLGIHGKANGIEDEHDAHLPHEVPASIDPVATPPATHARQHAVLDLPFDHPDVRVIIDTMFLEGTLHPLIVQTLPKKLPEWARVGVVRDPHANSNLVAEGCRQLLLHMPDDNATHRDWTQFARRMGEVLTRFYELDVRPAIEIEKQIAELQSGTDAQLRSWVGAHYSDLPSLPVAKGPVMVHHIPRYLALRRDAGEEKIALLVFDGLAVDQWVQIREQVSRRAPRLAFDENACFAWLPTLTSVSRQALFSGMKPREFTDSIETTAQEAKLWTHFWKDHGLREHEVLFQKGVQKHQHFYDLNAALNNPAIKVAGIVVDTVDKIIHGAMLGKRGVVNQISSWCESGFVEDLFTNLLGRGFHVYLTADHGNIEATGQGRPNQGVVPEHRGERVRIYRSEMLLNQSTGSESYRQNIAGLPSDFMPLFADRRTAFVPQGEQVVVHGGISAEELIVPFVKVSYLS